MRRIFLSNHSLGSVAVCGTKHVLEWEGYRPKEEAVALRAGADLHTLLQQWRLGMSPEDALESFELGYKEFSEANVPTDESRDWRNLKKIMAEYMRRRPFGEGAPWDEVVAVEQGYAAPLYTDEKDEVEYWYLSYPDMVVRRDGRLYTVDTKTTGWLKSDWDNQWDVSPQISGQCWVVEQVLGEQCRDAFVDGIELKRANSSSSKCKTHGVPYHECATEHMNFKYKMTHREVFQLAEWARETIKLCGRFYGLRDQVERSGLASVGVEGIYTGACVAYGRFCDFYSWCSTGRQVGMLGQMFVVDKHDLASKGDVLGPGGVVVAVER